MLWRLKSAWIILRTWVPFLFFTIGFGLVGMVAGILHWRWLASRCMHWWAKASCLALGIKVRLVKHEKADWADNLEHLTRGVIICNHASHLDILMIMAQAPLELRCYAKSSLFKLPFLGWYLTVCGHIPVFKGSQRHLNMTRGLEITQKALDEGANLLFFPEGTRSKTGEVTSFKRGAFQTAERHNLIIYPLVLVGSSELLRPGSYLIHGEVTRPCELHLLPALSPIQADKTQLPLEERVTLSLERSFEQIKSCLEERSHSR